MVIYKNYKNILTSVIRLPERIYNSSNLKQLGLTLINNKSK